MKRTHSWLDHDEVNDGGSWHSWAKCHCHRYRSSRDQYPQKANSDDEWQWKSRSWSWYPSWDQHQSHENDSWGEWTKDKDWYWYGDGDGYSHYHYRYDSQVQEDSWQWNSWSWSKMKSWESWDEGGHCGHCRCPGCECEKFKSQSKSNYWFDSQYGDSDDSLPQLPIQPKKSCLLKKSSVPEPRKQVVFGEDELVMFANHPEDQEWRLKVPMADAMEVLEPPDRWMYARKYREALLELMNGQPFLTSTLHKDDVWYDKVNVEYMKWFGGQVDYNRPWYSIKRRHMKWNFERECFEDVDLVWNVQDWNAIAARAVAANAA